MIEGRGREALRLSALGSGLAVVFAVPLAVPLTLVMKRVYPLLRPWLSVLLVGVAVLLVVTEHGRRQQVGAACSLAASGLLGVSLLDAPVTGALPVSDVLVPLFSGLFGAPVLLAASGGWRPATVRRGGDDAAANSRRLSRIGTLCGGAVGYIPGTRALSRRR